MWDTQQETKPTHIKRRVVPDEHILWIAGQVAQHLDQPKADLHRTNGAWI